MAHETIGESIFPKFEAGKVFRQTSHFRIVMGYKSGLVEGMETGQRFFIEPLTVDAEQMLMHAAGKHNVFSISHREVTFGPHTTSFACLRADFIPENIAPLFFGVTQVPEEGKDSIPAPDRMEECLNSHPDTYTFSD